MKNLFVTCVLVVGIALLAPSMASAQATGATDVDITLPDIVILHYFTNVDLSITNTALGTFLTGSAGDASIDEGTAGPAAGGMTFDLNIVPDGLTGNPAAVVLTLQNAWAVRAISLAAGTNTQLAITITDGTLDHNSTAATMSITAGTVDDGNTTGSTISFATPGLVNPQSGDVILTLDMALAVNAGTYEDGVFTLVATNI
ncbi:MAG: hypothetical protein K8R59_07160 [Thermoanaerobaculales bacterium]|nr:hypothetical protein [Thermoanaerobaculales bacterium]